jgi:RNA methyltransferase, TrmH family
MASEKITSLKNEGVKKVLELRDRRGRDASGLTLIDGVREIMAAFKAGVIIPKLYVCPDVLTGKEYDDLTREGARHKTEVLQTVKAVSQKMAFGDRDEGAVAVAKPHMLKIAELRLSKKPLLVVVEQVEKPGNLGAILRTCDAAGVDAVLVCDARTDIYNPNVIRSSLGAVFTVNVATGPCEEVLKFLKANKVKIVGTFPDATLSYERHDFKIPSAIVLGSEQAGLSAFWQKNSEVKVRLPMHGQVNSLNVSATAAIVIYEAVRQRT